MNVVYQVKFSIILSIIIVIGLLGNIINLFVFYQKKSSTRKNSTFKYLFYLALIDILVLLIAATDSLSTYGYSISLRLYSVCTCKIHTFVTYFLTHLSSLVLMIISIDRAIIICQKSPNDVSSNNLMFKISCSFKKVRKVLLYLILFLVGVNFHFIAFLTINKIDRQSLNETNLNESKIEDLKIFNNTIFSYEKKTENNTTTPHFFICFPLENQTYSYFLIGIWIWIDALIYSLIPFVVMVICSIIIIVEIKTKSKGFLKSCEQNGTRKSTNRKICIKSKRRNRKLSLMLLFNNIFFILCSLPFRLNMLYYNYRGEKDETYSFQAYFHILAYSNNSFNFIFYFVFSNKYRQLIRNFFINKCKQTNKTRNMTSSTVNNNTLQCRQNSILNRIAPTPSHSVSFGQRRTSKLLTIMNLNEICYIDEIDKDDLDEIKNVID